MAKVGEIYEIEPKDQLVCTNFYSDNGKYIRIRDSAGDYLSYEILNAKLEVVSGCTHCFEEKHLTTLVTDPSVKKPEFKEGDTVRIAGANFDGSCADHVGEIGIVELVDCVWGVKVVNASWLGCRGFHFFNPKNLKLVDETTSIPTASSSTVTSKSVKGAIGSFNSGFKNIYYKGVNVYGNDSSISLFVGNQPKPKKSMTKVITNLVKKLVDQETQDLIKIGWLDDELVLTEEGRDALLERMFLEKKTELAQEAKELLAEEAKKK